MSSNLSLGTGELYTMQVAGGGESLWKQAFKRLLKDKVAVAGGIVIIALVLLALFAPVIAPHDPNKQYSNATSAYGMPLPINSYGKTLRIELRQPAPHTIILPKSTFYLAPGGAFEYKTREDVTIAAGKTSIEIPINPLRPDMISAPAGTVLVPEAFEFPVRIKSLQLQNDQHFWLGTDANGRDVLSRLIYGSQVSLEVGLVAIGLAAIIGCLLGLISGYFGGWIDMVIMRFTDIMMAFPDLLLVMAIVAVKGPSLGVIFVAIGLVSWTQFARIVRSQVLSIREMEFIEACKAIGVSDIAIMLRHILPNVAAPVIVVSTMGIAGAIMTEAALSFLGFGVKVPTASWGSMINDGLGYFRDQPLIPLIPGLTIAVTVFAFNLFGDGLRDALDPRLKG